MVCIYCGSRTNVTNSRAQKRQGTTWRRRVCRQCGAIFTTIEQADLRAGFRVRKNSGELVPFNRNMLFLSIAKALGHRRDAVEAADALMVEITAQLVKNNSGAVIELSNIIQTTLSVLGDFDMPAGVQYAAYHSSA